jgi:hypothetical protein
VKLKRFNKKPERSNQDLLRHSFDLAELLYFMGSTTGGGVISTGASEGALLPQEDRENPARAAIRPRIVVIFIVVFWLVLDFSPKRITCGGK